ncbi:hypothetical protein CPB84DRAFT_1848615 [Gymnopilus junonius]|uniref:Uncharacterized protein n=1 Tax=Gymnopilus junonius TaxID=109634 RepID=A0A9P5TMC2_GYMJU|nr:hypothetical protein CPB84DRAFT_1848615 [Gymnopilus junonius]
MDLPLSIEDQFLYSLELKRSSIEQSEIFLPFLQHFVYEGDLTFTWEALIVFASGLQYRMSSSGTHFNPCPSIQIHIVDERGERPTPRPAKSPVSSLIYLQDSGFNIQITERLYDDDKKTKIDLLQKWRREYAQ